MSAQTPGAKASGRRINLSLLVFVVATFGAFYLAFVSVGFLISLGIGEAVVASILNFATHSVFILAGILMVKVSGLSLPKFKFLPRTGERTNTWVFGAIALAFSLIAVSTNLVPPVTKEIMSPLSWGLEFLFQALFVGWSEELLFRGALQNILNHRFSTGRKIIRIREGTFIASVIFATVHLGNAFLGQSVTSAVGNAIFALAFSFAVGWYYDKTKDLAGAAWIHNATDGFGTLATFLFSIL
jgi:membrane protease YdiL (CAAX protease family)